MERELLMEEGSTGVVEWRASRSGEQLDWLVSTSNATGRVGACPGPCSAALVLGSSKMHVARKDV